MAVLTNIHVVLSSGVVTVEGIAVDWMGHNLYWTVGGSRSCIQVAQLYGEGIAGANTKTLISRGIHSPRAIALDPRDGVMFWTDWAVSETNFWYYCLLRSYKKVFFFFYSMYFSM